ncbi:IS110 family transposase [Abyssisolibacter fermentans]|uniref:IS110 family transposase n=1 Tax=Abyssisolibacter fermentans TaxID=1766203 RepID=UPI001FA7279F|nr:transposase [Abyssisolibacter fermentans]
MNGKKSDKKDSLWLADLHKHGLVHRRFIPPVDIRNLRDICRYRTKLVSNRSSEKNRVKNFLTVSNIVISNVVSDTFGKSSSEIIQYLIQCSESGSSDSFSPEHCKSLLRKSLNNKKMGLLRS